MISHGGAVDPSVAITQVDASTFSERLKKALRLRRLSYQQFRNSPKSLSAAPGLGKSTLLRKLALDIYREALTRTASLGANIPPGALQIPILVSATEMAEYDDPCAFLEDHLPPEDMRASFSVSCLLVDALDEVPQKGQASTLTFARDRQAVELRHGRIGSSSTRSSGSGGRDLPVVQLLPLEYSQALQLVNRLVRDPEIVDILREGIANLQSHMALSPLSVSLLLDIAQAEREVPGTIGEIFDQYMDIALGRYDVDRGIEVVFQYFIKKQLLSELAWFEFFDRLSIEEDEFDKFLNSYFDARRFAKGMHA